MRLTASVLLLGMIFGHKHVTKPKTHESFWRISETDPGEADYYTFADHHYRLCGVAEHIHVGSADQNGPMNGRVWAYYTLQSSGAHEGVTGSTFNIIQSKLAVESDCPTEKG